MTVKRFYVLAAWIVAIAMLLVVAMRGIELFYPEASPSPISPLQEISVSPTINSQQLASQLQRQALFGKTAPSVVKQNQTVSKSSLPKLNVVVTGVLFSESGKSVVNLRHSGISEALSEGDFLNLAESVQVQSITASAVTFLREEQQSVVEVAPRESKQQIIELHSHDQINFSIVGKVNRRIFQSALAELRKNPERIDYYLSFVDAENGQGKRIMPGKDPRIFTMMPFQLGDLIISVNNRPAMDMRSAEFAELLTSQSDLQIEMIRNQQQKQLQLVIK